VGLAPSLAAENAAVHAEAHEAFLAWEAESQRIRAERKRQKAELRAQLEAAAVAAEPPKPALTPFWMPPVGAPRPG
jgi:hypothetical protein